MLCRTSDVVQVVNGRLWRSIREKVVRMAQRSAFPALQRRLISKHSAQRIVVALLLLGLLFLAGTLAVGFVRMAWQEHQLNRSIDDQRSANAQLAADNLRLKGQAEWAESDVAAEQAARERLGMAREGEIVLLPTVVLPAATAAPPSAPTDQTSLLTYDDTAAMSNSARWFHALFPGPNVLP